MKVAILLLLAIFGFSICTPTDDFAEQAGITIDEALELVGGILDGLNVKGDVNHIQECLAKVPEVIKTIKELIEKFKEVNWKDLDAVFELFSKLFNTLKVLFDTIKPCFNVPSDINTIIEKLKKIDPTKLLAKIMEKIWVIFTTITDCLKKFEKKLYREAGKDIGDIIYLLLLEDVYFELGASFKDFMKGFLEGLGVKQDIEKILECVKEGEHIWKKIEEALKHLKHFSLLHIKDIIKGLEMLFSAVKECVHMIENCAKDVEIIKKLIKALAHINIHSIAYHIIKHAGSFAKDIAQLAAAIAKKDMHTAGKALGDIVKKLILGMREEEDSLEASFKDFMKGMLEGLGVKKDIEKILECVKEGEGILKKIEEAINKLKHISLRHIKDLVKGLEMLFSAVKECIAMIKECAKEVDVIKKLINALAHLNFMSLAYHLIKHAGAFAKDIAELAAALAKKDLYTAGKALGDIIRKLVLGATEEEDNGSSMKDFFRGLLEGLGVKQDIEKILECVKENEEILKKIEKALHDLKHLNILHIKTIVKGITALFHIVKECIHMIEACAKGVEIIKKLIHALTHFNPMSIAYHLIKHAGSFAKDIAKMIACIGKKDLHCVGHALGDFVKKLLLGNRETDTLVN